MTREVRRYRSGMVWPNKSGEYLRTMREFRGMSVAEVAATVNRTTETVRRWERHGLSPLIKASVIFKVCRVYNVNVDSIACMMKVE